MSMPRVWTQGFNPHCHRPECRHPLRGRGQAGHFNLGAGPCKSVDCSCLAFLAVPLAMIPEVAGRARGSMAGPMARLR